MGKENRKEIIRTLSKEEAITLLESCNGTVTIVVESNSVETTTLCNKGGFDPVQLLPACLLTNGTRRGHGRLMHRAAFCRAFEVGYLKVVDGRIVSNFKTKSLLAYFTGRVFSNDHSKSVFGHACWVDGGGVFPGKMVEQVFGVANLRELRKKHIKNRTIAEGYKEVDRLFVARP